MSEPTYQDWKNAVARFVSYRMNAMGITVEELAIRSSLPVSFITEILEAKRYPTHKARSMLEKALGATLEFVEPKTQEGP